MLPVAFFSTNQYHIQQINITFNKSISHSTIQYHWMFNKSMQIQQMNTHFNECQENYRLPVSVTACYHLAPCVASHKRW